MHRVFLKMSRYWLAVLSFPLLLWGGDDVLKLQCIPSPNLVENADFSVVNDNGHPAAWSFDNCSESPHFHTKVIRDAGGNYLAVDTAWIQFGYWLQSIPVREGVSYFVSCEVQSDAPVPAIWLQCKETRKPEKPMPGQTRWIVARSLRQGDELKEMLKDFVDEELIANLSPVRWNSLNSEITIPSGRGIESIAMRIGIYGGNEGQARFRKPVFRESKSELRAEIKGTGWVELRIEGAVPAKVPLNPAAEKQSASVTLPKSQCVYEVQLLGKEGRKVLKEVANE